MGSKFIPSFYYDNFSIIKDEFLKVDEEIQNFNTQLFIKDSQLNRMNDLSNIGRHLNMGRLCFYSTKIHGGILNDLT